MTHTQERINTQMKKNVRNNVNKSFVSIFDNITRGLTITNHRLKFVSIGVKFFDHLTTGSVNSFTGNAKDTFYHQQPNSTVDVFPATMLRVGTHRKNEKDWG